MSVICGFCIKFTDQGEIVLPQLKSVQENILPSITSLTWCSWTASSHGVEWNVMARREEGAVERPVTPNWGWLAENSSETAVKRSAFALAGLMTPVQHRVPVAYAGIGDWSPLQNCQFHMLSFFSSFLWIEISPWQMIPCSNCPKVTPSCEISRAVSVGAEPGVEACILISYGLTSLMKWMVVVGHLTLAYFAVFVSEKRQKAQLQQRSWKLQVWAWLENAKLPSVVRLCGVFFLQAICLEIRARIENNRSNWS